MKEQEADKLYKLTEEDRMAVLDLK